MLDQWIRKGRVRRLDGGGEFCGGCCGCTDKLPEVYEWVPRGCHPLLRLPAPDA